MYSAAVLDHFEHPRNAGELSTANAGARVENPDCADILELALRIEDGTIREARFLAKGCVPAIACGSVLTTLLIGRDCTHALALQPDDLQDALGGLPRESSHAAQLAIEACRAALRVASLPASLKAASHE